MDRSKLLIAGVGSCLVIITVCFGVITWNSSIPPETIPGNQQTQRTRPESEREIVTQQSVGLIPTPTASAEGGAISAPAGLNDQIASLSEKVDELRAQASDLAAAQWRLEALIHNLAVSIGNSSLRVPSYEEHQQTLVKFKAEVEHQRQILQEVRRKAVEVARSFGLPESTVDADISEELVLPPGRDYSALSIARAKLLQTKKILNAAELRYSEGRMMQTLPPAGSEQ